MRRLLWALVLGATLSVAAVVEAQSGTTVYIVRHAEKAATPVNDPPLTEDGRTRALALKTVLADAKISAIISTPTIRTTTTAVPLAEALGLTIETMAVQGTIAAHAGQVAAAVQAKRLVVFASGKALLKKGAKLRVRVTAKSKLTPGIYFTLVRIQSVTNPKRVGYLVTRPYLVTKTTIAKLKAARKLPAKKAPVGKKSAK